MKVDHLANPWKVGAAKLIDFPIETVDYYGKRVVVARVPITSRVDAEAVANLVALAPEFLKVLQDVAASELLPPSMSARIKATLAKIPGGAQ